MAEKGIEVRHRKGCAGDRNCACHPSVRATVYDARTCKRIRRSFDETGSLRDRIDAATRWRLDAEKALRNGRRLTEQDGRTFAVLYAEWLRASQEGSLLTKKGLAYSPSTMSVMQRYASAHVVPYFGTTGIAKIHSPHIARFVKQLTAAGKAPGTVRQAVASLSAVFTWAVELGYMSSNPALGVTLPSGNTKRDRIATPAESDLLLAALNEADRVVWALGFDAGLRRSEIFGLKWSAIDMKARKIRVCNSRLIVGNHEVIERSILKSRAAERTVPLIGRLREELEAHAGRVAKNDLERQAMLSGRSSAFVCELTSTRWSAFLKRAYAAWRRAELEPIRLHECRHTFASVLIASWSRAGMTDMKRLCTYMGHSSVTLTWDLYGHLLPQDDEAMLTALDAYVETERHSG